jgi:hypothetical protein
MPELNSAGNASAAIAAITSAVARGDLTTAEASELSRLVDAYLRSIEAIEFESRLRTLEKGPHAP